MLKYLVILLDDTAVSYCHYENTKTEKRLISLDDLKAGVLFAMKHNLTIQFVYPDYELPAPHKEAIETIDHIKMMSSENSQNSDADVIIFQSDKSFTREKIDKNREKILVVKSSKKALSGIGKIISENDGKITRLNLVLTDIETFTEEDFAAYKQFLEKIRETVEKQYRNGQIPQINLLTDRILLEKMNNCNAGVENITLAPNGKFYICPAFYFENEEDNIGALSSGTDIKNPQLYRLEYAPLCRRCDAFQCRRCVWLNRKTTLEVNTPSHEQCVTAHLERNASEKLCNDLKSAGYFSDKEIKSVDYLDPFETIEKF
ncbi:MAG: CXXX repeat peptide maturase [Dysgonamonadaceae bacterium]|jgi:CXXX repeat peptide maturase|nr:CXXX repeat peptide maturase [Dysgonamonadaceae bacterium]